MITPDSLLTLPTAQRRIALTEVNQSLEQKTAEQRVAWALENLPGEIVLSSSFGIQAAVMLHMVTRQRPDIPVILVDTGYLFKETYQFIDGLTEQLDLNLQVYRCAESAAWQEARHGRLWEQGIEGIDRYNKMNKVEPMQRAMRDLGVGTWFSGLRRSQSSTRAELPVVDLIDTRFKVLPIIDWSNKDVHYYLKENGLDYHPLWDQGYVSVGDHHSSRPLEAGMTEEETRFFGLKRECGLHDTNVMGDGI
ncbi:phosphoadenylyl-sulfate reductase [Corallincola holothuriorum]|uniref:Phosphoadenosine 5'-phosphosulfate reductase n=2 Tax=Corallincola holothuriorum TaxID=2282215 RepID=A0A368NLX0_9GAMM|nr:phosphoadenylyl-sulfate reductase [Corallincola holothuriorum]RCU51592.1 phosphoadenylyl-sulfate reductase [Corallincola holothuriorum]